MYKFLLCSLYFTTLVNAAVEEDSAKVFVSRKRSVDPNSFDVRVEAFNQVFQLELTKRDSPFSKRFNIVTTGKNRKESNVQDRSSLPQLYTDQSGEATVLLTDHGDGNFAIEGILNKRYAIAPKDSTSSGSHERGNAGNELQHFAFIRDEENDVHCDGGIHQTDDDDGYDDDDDDDEVEPTAEDFIIGNFFLPKIESPQSLLVEIAVVLDYASTQAFNNDSAKVKNYLSIFYDEVRKIYKSVTKVNYKIEIIAVILTPESSGDAIKNWLKASTSVLKEFGEWMYANHADIAFDYAVLHTMADIHGATGDGNLIPSTNGVAYIAQACVMKNSKEVNYNVGIIEDTPTRYVGIRISAHELGHNLGCTHDGEGPVAAPKNQPSSASCMPQDGYIMSYYPHDTNAFSFSPCSLNQLKWFSELSISECLQEKSNRIDMVPLENKDIKSLPGYSISLQQQCVDLYGSNASVYDPTPIPLVCTQLWCKVAPNDGPIFRGPALEGTKCGDGKLCNQGLCVSPSNFTFK